MILLEIGGVFLLIRLLLQGLKAGYNTHYGRSFVQAVGVVLIMSVATFALDVLFSYWSDGWLFFPYLIGTMKLLLTGSTYDYSDLLNVQLSLFGIFVTFALLYVRFLLTATIVKDKKVIRIDPNRNIPVYVPIKEFSYVYSWLVLTTMCVFTFFSYVVFDLGSDGYEKRFVLSMVVLAGVWELLLTIYFFEWFKQIRRVLFLLELLEKQNKIPSIFQLVDLLLEKSWLILNKETLPKEQKDQRLLELCIEYEVMEKSALIQTTDGSVCIHLTKEAELFFQHQATILEEGIVVG